MGSQVGRFAASVALLLVCVIGISAQTVRYVYDAAGRLVAVIDQNGDAAIYTYDAVGNVLSIARQSAGVVSVLQFFPKAGAVGQNVTLYGTGFSATASQNTVAFNGTSATVVSATTTQMVVTVPSGATTGTIAVTSPSGNATSSSSFSVTASTAPTISGFSPTSGASTTSVTVSGTNFDTTANRNRLVLNSTPTVVGTASATSLATNVPASATSGKVSVTTSNGTAVSTSDFIVAPPPYAISDIAVTDRITPTTGGTAKTVTISSANKIGLILFDAVAGQRVSLKIGTGVASTITLFNYNHQVLRTGTAGGVEAFFDTVQIPVAASYTILVDPIGSNTGSVTLTLYDVPADDTHSITPTTTGTVQAVATTVAGQNGRVSFTGTAGQRVSLKVSPGPIGAVYLMGPDRGQIASLSISPALNSFIDTQTLTLAGTYSIIVDYSTKNTGTATLTLYNVPADVTGTLTAGTAQSVSTGTPGQNGAYTFGGSAGQRVSVYIASVSMSANVSIVTGSGTTLGTAMVTALPGFVEPVTLPATATYTVLVDPSGLATGGVAITLYNTSADVSGSLTVGGSGVNVSLPTPGQNAALTFSGTSGQQVTVRVTGSDFRNPANAVSTVTVKLVKSDGTVLTSMTSSGSTFNLTTQTLPATGTYTVIIDPTLANKGALTVSVTNP